jgi:hypothetical protein
MAADGGASRSQLIQLAGGCHCGSLEVRFATECAPAALTVRACACSFCRRHGVRAVSDPRGRLEFLVHDPAQLNRYRFGLATAEFLICRRCGVYLGALMSEGGAAYAIVNVNALATPEIFPQAPVPMSYDRESEAERRARRRAGWTPAALIVRAGTG